jgi:hypothetical protein
VSQNKQIQFKMEQAAHVNEEDVYLNESYICGVKYLTSQEEESYVICPECKLAILLIILTYVHISIKLSDLRS